MTTWQHAPCVISFPWLLICLGVVVVSYSWWQIKFRVDGWGPFTVWFSGLLLGLGIFGYGIDLRLDQVQLELERSGEIFK